MIATWHEPWRQWRVRYGGHRHVRNGSIHATRKHNAGKWGARHWGCVDRAFRRHAMTTHYGIVCYPH